MDQHGAWLVVVLNIFQTESNKHSCILDLYSGIFTRRIGQLALHTDSLFSVTLPATKVNNVTVGVSLTIQVWNLLYSFTLATNSEMTVLTPPSLAIRKYWATARKSWMLLLKRSRVYELHLLTEFGARAVGAWSPAKVHYTCAGLGSPDSVWHLESTEVEPCQKMARWISLTLTGANCKQRLV